jgi:hypothetical protein
LTDEEIASLVDHAVEDVRGKKATKPTAVADSKNR